MSLLATAVRKKYPAITDRTAARFLSQACYGYEYSDIQSLSTGSNKSFDAWLNTQMTGPTYSWVAASAEYDSNSVGFIGANAPFQFHPARVVTKHGGPTDKLASRLCYALHKFFPINFGSINGTRNTSTGFLDAVEQNIFSNFRNLIEAVSRNPVMGRWLSFIGSGKATATNQPDENYARELMQLFTIGLWELNQDGTRKKTGELAPSDARYVPGGTDEVPTYTLADVAGLARVFTGWGAAGSTTTMRTTPSTDAGWLSPNVNVAAFHETGEKTFLGLTIPANTNGEQSLELALDHLFNHANTPVFFSKAMIQMLTTSNPSPAYVSRVASAFINNGQGVRGDLKAVWKAILTDQEARSESVKNDPTWGRVTDCYEVFIGKFSGLGTAYRPDGLGGPLAVATQFGDITANASFFAQFVPPSVFGNYSSTFSPSSSSTNEGRVSPELQAWGEVNLSGVESYSMANQRQLKTLNNGDVKWESGSNDIAHFPIASIETLPTTADKIERINLLVFGGQMSEGLKADVLSRTAADTDTAVWEAGKMLRQCYCAPEFYVQK